MADYSIFHDGSFDGLWLDGKCAHIFLATPEHEAHVIVASGVVLLKADDVRQGNIIFDVILRPAAELSPDDLDVFLHDYDDPKRLERAKALLQTAQVNALTFLQITPSYGAICSVMGKTFESIGRKEWLLAAGPGTPVQVDHNTKTER